MSEDLLPGNSEKPVENLTSICADIAEKNPEKILALASEPVIETDDSVIITKKIKIPRYDAEVLPDSFQLPQDLRLTKEETEELLQYATSKQSFKEFEAQKKDTLAIAIGKVAAEQTYRVIKAAKNLLTLEKQEEKKGILGRLKNFISPDKAMLIKGEISNLILRASEVSTPEALFPKSQIDNKRIHPRLTKKGQLLLEVLFTGIEAPPKELNPQEAVNAILKVIQTNQQFWQNIVNNKKMIQEFFIALHKYNPPRPDPFSYTNIKAKTLSAKERFVPKAGSKEWNAVKTVANIGAHAGSFFLGPVGGAIGSSVAGAFALLVYIAISELKKK